MNKDEHDTAVVTGAGGGLGQALSHALRQRGLEVIGVDLNPGPGVDELLDVTDAQACADLAQRVRPRIWVNNAGVLRPGKVATQPEADIVRMLEVNLFGVIYGSRASAEVMVADGRGQILNIGSMASWIGVPGVAVYAASKHGVRAFSQTMNQELKGTGVEVKLLCPDGISTAMVHEQLGQADLAMVLSARRLLEPAEVVRAAMALLDGRAAIRSVPRLKGTGAAALGALPGLWSLIVPILTRRGATHQRSLAAAVAADAARES